MKKKVMSLLILAMMGGSAMAGDKPVITVADVETLPGQTVSFAVNLADGKANTYTAMTLYAYFPTTGFTTTGATISSVWEGASTTVGAITNTGLATIPFASSNKIPGSAVDNLVTVKFTVDASVSPGEYDVTLKGTMFEYNTSDKDYADDITFKVIVTDRLTLDENSTVLPSAVSGANVKVKRTINANTWSTICLPFDMDKDQVENVFGDDVQLAEYIDHKIDDTTTPINIAMNFESVDLDDGFYANCPYLIKTSKDITEFSVNNVDIDPDEDEAIAEYNNGKNGTRKVVYGIFKGIYRAETIVPNKCFFLNNSEFYFSTGKTEMKAFRGYFELYNLPVSSNARVLLSIVDNDGNTTKIDGRTMEPIETGKVYNISGQYVGEAEKTDRLPKGIYIVNGKKKVIK